MESTKIDSMRGRSDHGGNGPSAIGERAGPADGFAAMLSGQYAKFNRENPPKTQSERSGQEAVVRDTAMAGDAASKITEQSDVLNENQLQSEFTKDFNNDRGLGEPQAEAVTSPVAELQADSMLNSLLSLTPQQIQELLQLLEAEYGDSEQGQKLLEGLQNLLNKPGLMNALQKQDIKGLGIAKALELVNKNMDLGHNKDTVQKVISDIVEFIEENAELIAQFVKQLDGGQRQAEGRELSVAIQRAMAEVKQGAEKTDTQTGQQHEQAEQDSNNPLIEGLATYEELDAIEGEANRFDSVLNRQMVENAQSQYTNRILAAERSGRAPMERLDIDPSQLATLEGIDRPGVASSTQTAAAARLNPNTGLPSFFVSQHVNDAEWPMNFAQRVSMMINAKLQNAEIRLNPPDLGPITIRLNIQNDQASVAFSSNFGVVREAIEQAIPRLREMLGEGGVSLASVDVNSHSQQERERQSAQADRDTQGTLAHSEQDGESEQVQADNILNQSAYRLRDRLLDTYA